MKLRKKLLDYKIIKDHWYPQKRKDKDQKKYSINLERFIRTLCGKHTKESN